VGGLKKEKRKKQRGRTLLGEKNTRNWKNRRCSQPQGRARREPEQSGIQDKIVASEDKCVLPRPTDHMNGGGKNSGGKKKEGGRGNGKHTPREKHQKKRDEEKIEMFNQKLKYERGGESHQRCVRQMKAESERSRILI